MDFIVELVDKYGLFIIFMLVMLEYACFPLPSELVLPFSGAVAASAGLSLIFIILLSTVAGYLGCLICYAIGRSGGVSIINKIKNKLPRSKSGLDKSEEIFLKYSTVSVAVGRVIPLCRTYISLIAGTFKQNLLKFSIYSLMGILAWNTFLISGGYLLADNWQIISESYNTYKIIVLLVLLTVIVGVFVIFLIRKKRNKIKEITNIGKKN